jgi:chromate reductase
MDIMTEQINVVGISGSLRKGSHNTALLRAAAELMPEGMSLEILDLASIPMYNGDLDGPTKPDAVTRIRERLAAADALIIASPEYNYSIPGVLKNALDWASRGSDSPLNGKPVALMGASPGSMGTVRMQMHLRQVLTFNNMFPLNKPEVYIAQSHTKFDNQGTLTDEKSRDLIRRQMSMLAVWTRQLQEPVAA